MVIKRKPEDTKLYPRVYFLAETAISGLLALTLMYFRLGYDFGVVRTKGIIFSILSVLLLMPELILMFPNK